MANHTLNHTAQTETCSICGQKKPLKQLMPVELVRDGIISLIKKNYANWQQTGYVCIDDLNLFRELYMEEALRKQKGEISAIDRRVMKGLKEHEIISQNVNSAFERQLTIGEKAADKIAQFGGSWRFVLSFLTFMGLWIVVNAVILVTKPVDPFPFILLNLMLSCLAALQAPIIMMSQNRMEDRDRMRSEEDYKVNLKAELEIRQLNDKLDHLLNRQWHRLLEIQQIQLDLMEEIAAKKTRGIPVTQMPPMQKTSESMPQQAVQPVENRAVVTASSGSKPVAKQ